MYKGGSKVLPALLVIIVIVVAIIALVAVGRALLNRGAQEQVVEDSPAERSLLVTEADRSVRMTVRGPIIADEEFHSYQIEVSPLGRRMTTYKGYQEETIETKQLGNSTDAYVEFVHALARANYTHQVELPEEADDLRGACATGRLYTFETLQAQSMRSQSWVSSCRNMPGSFKGDAAFVRSLFLKQIPESNKMLQPLNL